MLARVERERIDTLSKSIQANEGDSRFFIARTGPLQIVPMFFKSLRKGCQAKSELFFSAIFNSCRAAHSVRTEVISITTTFHPHTAP